jgi:predicted DCC family thiol-disulfide oxidoreductase YuxK
VNTEITETNVRTQTDWILYDGQCALCTNGARRYGGILRRAGFQLATLQSRFGEKDFAEMLVQTRDGKTFGGADAYIEITRRIWWAWPLFALTKIPGVTPLLHSAYRKLAANRHCFGGKCSIKRQNRFTDWLPLVLFPAATLFTRDFVPAWLFMWLIALALFLGSKWLTWRRAVREIGNVSKLASLGYLFAWIGMDAKNFLHPVPAHVRPDPREWFLATFKISLGAIVLWIFTRQIVRMNELAAAWLGMIGITLILHFGIFHLLALVWQRAGFNAQPIMNKPLLATSLGDFWGRRWNAAFHLLAHNLMFRPLARRVGVRWTTLLVFLISGLVHDLVISVPARGGYGLPTMYFLIQGAGVIFERAPLAKRFGLGRGWRGWLFTFLVAAGPAFWLFHPIFIRNVILPMLKFIGAI